MNEIEDNFKELGDAINRSINIIKYKKEAHVHRGIVLHMAIEVERIMEQFLSYYFCSHDERKRLVLLNTVFCGNTDFARKIRIVNYIFNSKSDDRYYYEYKFSVASKYLEELLKTRNAIAHRALSDSNVASDAEAEEFIFKDNYGNKATLIITDEVLNDLSKKYNYCEEFFEQEIKEIKNLASED